MGKALKVINKDITTVKEGIIGHQVNLQGVMGSGLALQIKNKWPSVFTRYTEWVEQGASLGDVLMVPVSDETTFLYVANLAGQDNYGSRGCDTDYDGLKEALIKLGLFSRYHSAQIYLPYKIGSCRGGGDWNIVEDIILETCPEAILCKL